MSRFPPVIPCTGKPAAMLAGSTLRPIRFRWDSVGTPGHWYCDRIRRQSTETTTGHVQEVLWAQRKPIQRKSGPALSVSDETDRRSSVRPDVRCPDAQGVYYADRRGGHR